MSAVGLAGSDIDHRPASGAARAAAFAFLGSGGLARFKRGGFAGNPDITLENGPASSRPAAKPPEMILPGDLLARADEE